MESMTDWAFSWPISAMGSTSAKVALVYVAKRESFAGHVDMIAHVGSSRPRSADDSSRYCALSGRSWNRA